jgi:hypothetical protein
MANDLHVYSLQITIDSTNKYIDWDTGGGSTTATLTEGDYDDIVALVAELETQLQAGSANFSASVSLITGLVTIEHSSSSFTIDWKTGTHGSDNDDDHIGHILGFDDSADDSSSGSPDAIVSDDKHQYCWWSGHAPEFDSKDRQQRMGPATFVAMSGRATRTTWATHEPREVRHLNVAASLFFAADSATNCDFETWWVEAAKGTPFSFYSDSDTPVDEGKYVLILDENASLEQAQRLSPAAEYYSFTLKMLKQP